MRPEFLQTDQWIGGLRYTMWQNCEQADGTETKTNAKIQCEKDVRGTKWVEKAPDEQ